MDDGQRRPGGGCDANTAFYRLATYGTLAPGRPNQHQLDGLEGRWFAGHVNGMLVFHAGVRRRPWMSDLIADGHFEARTVRTKSPATTLLPSWEGKM